jgi:hypothetical protein
MEQPQNSVAEGIVGCQYVWFRYLEYPLRKKIENEDNFKGFIYWDIGLRFAQIKENNYEKNYLSILFGLFCDECGMSGEKQRRC